MFVFLLLIALLIPVSVAHAQSGALPAAARAAANRINAAQLKRDLDFLSSDALRGRNTPSPGFDSAAAYIARRLQRAGLKPLGDNGTFLQHYELREERIDTAQAYIEIGGQRFRFGDDLIMRSFAGPLSGSVPVVFVGHGWTVAAQNIDPYAGVDVRGKLVLAYGPESPRNLQIQQIGRVTVGSSNPYVAAQQRGAAGIIYISPQSALTGWEGLRRASVSRLELHPIVPSAYAAIAITSVGVKPQVAEVLLAGERVTVADVIAGAESGRFPPSFQLAKSVTLNVPLANRTVHRPFNVVAMIEGTDPVLRNEYITLESHLDGAVGRSARNGDSIYNAADDNASGSAGNLSIAEQMMTARPKRSLIFIWDSGEERGLWGTRHFVHAPPVPLDRIVAHFNIDMIGATRAPGSPDSASMTTSGVNEVFVGGPRVLSPQVDSLMERVNRSYLNMTLNRSHDRIDSEFLYPRTDAGPFLERGILTINFFTGLHGRYHAPDDEARYLDPAKIEAVTRTAFAFAWMLADSPVRPRIEKELPPSVPRHR